METLGIKSTFRRPGGTPAQIFNLARFSSALVNTSERRCVKCGVLFFQGFFFSSHRSFLVGSRMEKRQRRQAARISASARTWKAFGRELSVNEELKKKRRKGAFDFTSPL